MFRLAVKFFPPDPGQLQEEYTRSVPAHFLFPSSIMKFFDFLIGRIQLKLKKIKK